MKILYRLEKDKNSVALYKDYDETELITSAISEDFEILKNKKDIIKGVRLNNVFEKNEIFGYKKELEFKEYLEDNHFPYLYIAQNPDGLEKSESLFDADCKRPDFFVNLNNLATVFIDVKARHRLNVLDMQCYYINNKDVDKLFNLKSSFNIPVYIAFCSEQDANFSFVQVDIISDYINYLRKYKANENLFPRIPTFLLKDSLLDSPTELEKYEEDIKKYVSAVNEIANDFKETSLKFIRRKKYILKKDLIKHQTDYYDSKLKGNEISHLFDEMVREKKIKYRKGEYLEII